MCVEGARFDIWGIIAWGVAFDEDSVEKEIVADVGGASEEEVEEDHEEDVGEVEDVEEDHEEDVGEVEVEEDQEVEEDDEVVVDVEDEDDVVEILLQALVLAELLRTVCWLLLLSIL